ncbi:transcriptional regulator [Streptomyces fructofermentans]|uniref:transcriptional regulator n=1 Tax=Streptomyces fructofermentans TaxID=152141 RepID=UPI0037B0C0FE
MDAIDDEVAEFALLLARLKQRTDRSYAALGHRLGMNASTLHRYCAGESVPLDFTRIERFAVLCGVTAEERGELHRRWILAVAARQRPRPSDAVRAAVPQDASGTTSGASAPDASTSRSGPVGEPPEPAPPAERQPRSWHPRRRPARSVALAAALAVALAGLVTSAAGPPSGGEPAASARTAPHTSAPAGDEGGRPLAGPSPSHDPSASARAVPKPSASDGRDADRRGEDGTGAGTAPPRTPLTWTSNSQLWQLECDHDYVIAKSPKEVPPPPAPADAEAWAASQQAVHGRTTDLRVSVQGRGSAAVVLEALHVRVVNRTTPAVRRGIAYSTYEGCGAPLVPRHFAVDLDARRTLARSVAGNDPGRADTAVDFPYRVSLSEPEVLLVSARTESCTCDWYLELDWSSQGRTGTVRIDDHGRPFRTTSIEGLPHYWYRDPRGWIPMTANSDNAAESDEG